jgi:hypothetical protein
MPAVGIVNSSRSTWVVVIWELSGSGEARQRRALQLIGIAFALLAVYLAVQSTIVLVTGLRKIRTGFGDSRPKCCCCYGDPAPRSAGADGVRWTCRCRKSVCGQRLWAVLS